MKICILTPRFPFPENGGDVLRINHIAQYLKSKGHQLCLVSYSEYIYPDIDTAVALYDAVYWCKISRWKAYCYSLLYFLVGKPLQCGYYYSSRYKKILKHAIDMEKPDIFVSHLLRMSPYLEKLGVTDKSVVEMTDALSRTYSTSEKASSFSLFKYIYRIERSRIKKYEAQVVQKFPKVVLVSGQDIDYLKTFCHEGASSLSLHTNGVICLPHPDDKYDPRKICFVGNMRTLQNQDAVFRFVENVFPRILREIPDVKLYIVGAQVKKNIYELASENIVITGYVDNMSDIIKNSCLAIAPIYIGAGIQNKVLVSMACGLPIVMTSLTAYAIPQLVNGENCMIEDNYDTFAQAVLSLMKNPDLRNSIATAGYKMVQEHYNWNQKLEGYLDW